MKVRCEWANVNELEIEYHDKQWGVPVHDDRNLFEFLILEGAQAGLSWGTILKRRDGYRKAFDDFDYNLVASYDDLKIEKLMQDSGIIRNRRKILSSIKNARSFIEIRDEFGSFSKYIWKFLEDGKPIQNSFRSINDMPANTELSEMMSKDLKKRGFSFVGPTIIYAFMQAVGMVNDHEVGCFRHEECRKLAEK
ncbi:DNA-3-methyladenine glycosylase I [Methanococcoides burtonii]|uniref:DNA-3-methyladenine glycosylase n=1 Tax=Methanococcoides burtonii (strain DSM 6242 / NBRC 107633 / OCM 468 / ACE-M) TaxID=259564 RepID=Q12YB5_METBU|nr:DNA-3-methyladenine glycosylase I [Methanococcoides burtonii]ABE51561.1 DNA-3-methyladenine glycosylase [Methanococcoides burtonii DSM 6242]